jgi:hypothetical protein
MKVEVSFDFDEKIAKMLEEMAKEEGKTENEFLEEALSMYGISLKESS